MMREFFSRADNSIQSGCCSAPMDSWIEFREHHVVCSVCRGHSVFKKVSGRIVHEALVRANVVEQLVEVAI